MHQELKNYILAVLIGKEEDSIYDERQEKVISLISEELYPHELDDNSTPICDAICSHVILTLHYKLINGGVIATNSNVWDLLTPEFCLDCAYDYVACLELKEDLVSEHFVR